MAQAQTVEGELLSSLRRITHAMDVYSRKVARECDLTVPQLVCLRMLAQHGPMLPSRLCREIALSQATVTGIIDRLAERKLVARRRSTTDKRCVTIRLTPAGQRAAETAPDTVAPELVAGLERLPDAERATLLESLRRVAEVLDSAVTPS